MHFFHVFFSMLILDFYYLLWFV